MCGLRTAADVLKHLKYRIQILVFNDRHFYSAMAYD